MSSSGVSGVLSKCSVDSVGKLGCKGLQDKDKIITRILPLLTFLYTRLLPPSFSHKDTVVRT